MDWKAELLSFLAFFMYAAIIIYQFVRHIWRVKKQGKKYFHNFWNMLDAFIIFLSFLIVYLFIKKVKLTEELAETLQNSKKNEYVDFENFVTYIQIFVLSLATIVCLSTLRLWQFLRFAFMFKVFERSLLKASKQLMGVFICNFILYCMFSLFGYLLFGSYSKDFTTPLVGTKNLILLHLGIHSDFDYDTLKNYFPTQGYLYYSLFMLCAFVIFNIYITVVIISYEESANYFSNLESSYSIKTFFLEESDYFLKVVKRKVLKIRLRGGKEMNVSKVVPKSNEHMYSDCFLIPTGKLELMAALVRCEINKLYAQYLPITERNNLWLKSTHDIVYQYLVTKYKGPKINILFLKLRSGNAATIISYNRMAQIEILVRGMLSKRETFKKKEKHYVTSNKLENIHNALDSIHNIVSNIKIILKTRQRS